MNTTPVASHEKRDILRDFVGFFPPVLSAEGQQHWLGRRRWRKLKGQGKEVQLE